METPSRRVIIDSEANGLKPTKIWCIVCKDLDTKERFKFRPYSPYSGHLDWQDKFKDFAKEVKTWIGHNLLGYDIYWINTILGMNIRYNECIDTLVLSRLFRPVPPFKTKKIKGDTRVGGHALEPLVFPSSLTWITTPK